MTQPVQLSLNDHDLLVTINERLAALKEQQTTNHSETNRELSDLRGRLTAVERIQDRQAGFISGGKAAWAIIGALPPSGIVALILGLNLK